MHIENKKNKIKLACIIYMYLFTSLSCPLNVVTVFIEEKTSSAMPPATAYFCCSRAEELATNCHKV